MVKKMSGGKATASAKVGAKGTKLAPKKGMANIPVNKGK
jgi:hypothetical protein